MLEIKKNNNIGISVATDTDSVDLTTAGSNISGVVRISSNAPAAGNILVPINVESAGVVGLRAQVSVEDIQDAVFGVVADTSSIDFTYDDPGNQLSAVLRLSAVAATANFIKTVATLEVDGLKNEFAQASVDHGLISGLADDDHAQYALLAGRGTGQVLIGGLASGNSLTLESTAHATKGSILFGSSGYDEVLNRLSIRDTSSGTALDVNGDMALRPTDNTDSGILTGVPVPDTSFVRFSLATEVRSITNAAEGKILVLANVNTVTVLVRNQYTTGTVAGERIITGTDDDIELGVGATLLLVYDGTTARWRVVGGSGGGSLSIKTTQTISAAGTIAITGTGEQLLRVQGNAGAVTVDATTALTAGTKDGQQCMLQGLSDVNTVTIPGVGNVNTNGACVLGNGDFLRLMWIAADSAWRETSRSE